MPGVRWRAFHTHHCADGARQKGQFDRLSGMSIPPPTGDREFRNQIVRISELTVNTIVLEGLTFQNCQIHGPAVLVPQGSGRMSHIRFDAPGGVDSIFWEIPANRTMVVGAIAVVNCTFSVCTFVGIGLAGGPDLRALLEAALGG